jgi:hypothetical protein
MFGCNSPKGTVVALWLAALATPALAVQPDLAACRWPNTGLVIPAVECQAMREYQAKQVKEQAEREARSRAAAEEDAQRRAAEAQQRAEQQARYRAEYEARRAREDQRAAEYRSATEKEDARYAAQQAAQAKAAAAVRRQCGADHGVVRVGMPFARVKQCAGPFRVTAEVNRRDGVLTTYQGQGKYVHVMEGQVVGWGQF